MTTLYTFGDSILDCAVYNDLGVHPGALLIRNRDDLFPAFRGRDLSTLGPARLIHRAQDGATVENLASQGRGITPDDDAIALLTVGGNDLLRGLLFDTEGGLAAFSRTLAEFLASLPIRRKFVGNVYDPTFGDDSRNFLPVDVASARAAHQMVNDAVARVAAEAGATLVDLHGHFLTGDPSWMVRTIEPSLTGASEVRRCFLDAIQDSP